MRIREAIFLIEREYTKIKERKTKLRRLEFLLLRSMGSTYQEIGAEMNCSAANANRIVENKKVKVKKVARELKKICDIISKSNL